MGRNRVTVSIPHFHHGPLLSEFQALWTQVIVCMVKAWQDPRGHLLSFVV